MSGSEAGTYMIIGNGDMASVLPDRDDLTFFASGVSNSSETRESEFHREATLLRSQDRERRLVYFSSLCVFYSSGHYAKHKRSMEQQVCKNFPLHTIIRIGNITWGKNPHTLINFMREQKRLGQILDVQDAYRYVLDRDEFLHWISMIPDFNCEMNIPGRRLTVNQIVREYVYGKNPS